MKDVNKNSFQAAAGMILEKAMKGLWPKQDPSVILISCITFHIFRIFQKYVTQDTQKF